MEVLIELLSQLNLSFVLGVISTIGTMYFGRDRWQKYLMRADEYADAIDQVTDQLRKNVDVNVDKGKSETKVSGGSGKGN